MSVYTLDKKRIGESIRLIRGELSMEAFAKQIGVTRGTINNYEKGRILPSRKIAIRIVEFEGIHSIDEFLYGKPELYLSNIFKTIPEICLTSMANELTLLQQLAKALDSKIINYGDELGIINYCLKLEPNLKKMPEFKSLLTAYSIEVEIDRFEIEHDETYRSTLLPILNREVATLENFSDYLPLIGFIIESIKTNEELKVSKGKPSVPLPRKSSVALERYFEAEFLTDLSAYEKYKLAGNLEALGASFFKFFDEFSKQFPIPIDILYRDYLNETKTIKDALQYEIKMDLEKYKKAFWE